MGVVVGSGAHEPRVTALRDCHARRVRAQGRGGGARTRGSNAYARLPFCCRHPSNHAQLLLRSIHLASSTHSQLPQLRSRLPTNYAHAVRKKWEEYFGGFVVDTRGYQEGCRGQRSTSGGRRRYRRVINAFGLGRQTHDQRGHRTSGYAFCFLRAVRANSWPRGLCVCARTAPSWASRARQLLAGGNPRAERGR